MIENPFHYEKLMFATNNIGDLFHIVKERLVIERLERVLKGDKKMRQTGEGVFAEYYPYVLRKCSISQHFLSVRY